MSNSENKDSSLGSVCAFGTSVFMFKLTRCHHPLPPEDPEGRASSQRRLDFGVQPLGQVQACGSPRRKVPFDGETDTKVPQGGAFWSQSSQRVKEESL